MPRQSFGISFDYTYDSDRKGALYWIATNRGRGKVNGQQVIRGTHIIRFPETWKNPHSEGRIRVTASSIEKGNPVKLVAKETQRIVERYCTSTSPQSDYKVNPIYLKAMFPRHGSPLILALIGKCSLAILLQRHVFTLANLFFEDPSSPTIIPFDMVGTTRPTACERGI